MSLPISGFTAVPNPQMLAFMAAQSFIMMMQAGEGWQYGKRKQSAKTNEEFNKQTPLTIMERQMSELKQAIPSIERSMNNMTPMIKMIVTQYGDFLAEIVKATPDVLTAAQGGQTLQGNVDTVAKEFNELLGGPPSAATIKKVGAGPQFLAGAQAGTAWVDPFMQSMQNFWNALASAVSGKETFGPPAPPPSFDDLPEDRPLNLAEFGAQNPPIVTPSLASRQFNPWTPSQLSKKAVIDSGLSPLATSAVNKFKKNIDTANALVESRGLLQNSAQAAVDNFNSWSGPMRASNSHIGVIHEQTLTKSKSAVASAVKRLLALRNAFRKTYGYYY